MRGLASIVALLSSSLAYGQAKIVTVEAPKGAEEKDIEGWNSFMNLTSTLTVTSNDNVIGQVDGVSTLFSLGLLAGADFVKDVHVFRSTLAINEGFARTPAIVNFLLWYDRRFEQREDVRAAIRRAGVRLVDPDQWDAIGLFRVGQHHEVLRAHAGRVLAALAQEAPVW